MKLRVERIDGETETIELNPGVCVEKGEVLNNLFDPSSRISHFFTLEGRYEGWTVPFRGHFVGEVEFSEMEGSKQ